MKNILQHINFHMGKGLYIIMPASARINLVTELVSGGIIEYNDIKPLLVGGQKVWEYIPKSDKLEYITCMETPFATRS